MSGFSPFDQDERFPVYSLRIRRPSQRGGVFVFRPALRRREANRIEELDQ
jgi:hypothetical protein